MKQMKAAYYWAYFSAIFLWSSAIILKAKETEKGNTVVNFKKVLEVFKKKKQLLYRGYYMILPESDQYKQVWIEADSFLQLYYVNYLSTAAEAFEKELELQFLWLKCTLCIYFYQSLSDDYPPVQQADAKFKAQDWFVYRCMLVFEKSEASKTEEGVEYPVGEENMAETKNYMRSQILTPMISDLCDLNRNEVMHFKNELTRLEFFSEALFDGDVFFSCYEDVALALHYDCLADHTGFRQALDKIIAKKDDNKKKKTRAPNYKAISKFFAKFPMFQLEIVKIYMRLRYGDFLFNDKFKKDPTSYIQSDGVKICSDETKHKFQTVSPMISTRMVLANRFSKIALNWEKEFEIMINLTLLPTPELFVTILNSFIIIALKSNFYGINTKIVINILLLVTVIKEPLDFVKSKDFFVWLLEKVNLDVMPPDRKRVFQPAGIPDNTAKQMGKNIMAMYQEPYPKRSHEAPVMDNDLSYAPLVLLNNYDDSLVFREPYDVFVALSALNENLLKDCFLKVSGKLIFENWLTNTIKNYFPMSLKDLLKSQNLKHLYKYNVHFAFHDKYLQCAPAKVPDTPYLKEIYPQLKKELENIKKSVSNYFITENLTVGGPAEIGFSFSDVRPHIFSMESESSFCKDLVEQSKSEQDVDPISFMKALRECFSEIYNLPEVLEHDNLIKKGFYMFLETAQKVYDKPTYITIPGMLCYFVPRFNIVLLETVFKKAKKSPPESELEQVLGQLDMILSYERINRATVGRINMALDLINQITIFDLNDALRSSVTECVNEISDKNKTQDEKKLSCYFQSVEYTNVSSFDKEMNILALKALRCTSQDHPTKIMMAFRELNKNFIRRNIIRPILPQEYADLIDFIERIKKVKTTQLARYIDSYLSFIATEIRKNSKNIKHIIHRAETFLIEKVIDFSKQSINMKEIPIEKEYIQNFAIFAIKIIFPMSIQGPNSVREQIYVLLQEINDTYLVAASFVDDMLIVRLNPESFLSCNRELVIYLTHILGWEIYKQLVTPNADESRLPRFSDFAKRYRLTFYDDFTTNDNIIMNLTTIEYEQNRTRTDITNIQIPSSARHKVSCINENATKWKDLFNYQDKSCTPPSGYSNPEKPNDLFSIRKIPDQPDSQDDDPGSSESVKSFSLPNFEVHTTVYMLFFYNLLILSQNLFLRAG